MTPAEAMQMIRHIPTPAGDSRDIWECAVLGALLAAHARGREGERKEILEMIEGRIKLAAEHDDNQYAADGRTQTLLRLSQDIKARVKGADAIKAKAVDESESKLPRCFLCRKPIKGRVHFQGGNRDHPAHRGCLVGIKRGPDGGI